MTAQKVRRYVFTGEPGGLGVGMRGDLLVNDPAHPVAVNRTEYIEYADVAGLVGALKKVADFGVDTQMDKAQVIWHLQGIARNELARWQS